jgi:cell division topological specificity factor
MKTWFKALFGGPTKNNTAHLAKERLQVIVAHERIQQGGIDFLPMLQKEITAVIAKYVNIGPDEVKVDFEQHGDRSVLELNITLPEHFMDKAKFKAPA